MCIRDRDWDCSHLTDLEVQTDHHSNQFHLATSGKGFDDDHNYLDDSSLNSLGRDRQEHFKSFLRNLLMHGVVGTALGGVCTIVGEPQNLLIANVADWTFIEFLVVMSPITVPVFFAGMITCFAVEKFKIAGFGTQLPYEIKEIFESYSDFRKSNLTDKDKTDLLIEAAVGVLLIIALVYLCRIGALDWRTPIQRRELQEVRGPGGVVNRKEFQL